jgi:hypothetical protein
VFRFVALRTAEVAPPASGPPGQGHAQQRLELQGTRAPPRAWEHCRVHGCFIPPHPSGRRGNDFNAKLSPFYYCDASEPLRNGVQLADAGVLLGISLVLLAAGAVAFNRCDIAV